MVELKEMIDKIKFYVKKERERNNLNKIDYFFISMLEISTSLAELGIYQGRKISSEEEDNWFKGSYHLDFWDSNLNTELYIPFCKKIKELHFFRKPS
jgi:hypothetical protein